MASLTLNSLFPGLTLSYSLTQNVNAIQALNRILGSANLDGKNSGGGNFLLGDALPNSLAGGGNNDLLVGLGGSDVLNGQGGDDVLVGNAGADVLSGSGGDDHLIYRLSEELSGNRDYLYGGANSPVGDTLWLALTWGEYAAYQGEIAEIGSLLQAQKDHSGITYDFKAFNLSFSGIENLEVILSNRAPTPIVVNLSVDEDTPGTTEDVLMPAADPDALDQLSVRQWYDSATCGSISYDDHGIFSYDPAGRFESLALGETATDHFSYDLADLAGAVTRGDVVVTIQGVNDRPIVATALSSQTDEDQAAYVLNLLDGASDIDHDAVLHVSNVREVNGVTNGWQLVGNTIEVTPGVFSDMIDGEFQNLNFTYLVEDEHGASVEQTLAVEVAGITDGPPLTVSLANGEKTNEMLMTISTEELTGIDRVAVGFSGLPQGVTISPLNGPETNSPILVDFVGTFGNTANFKITLPTDQDLMTEFTVTAEGYRRNELVTGTTERGVDINYDISEVTDSSLSFGTADQSIWGSFTGEIGWHQYIPIIGGEAATWNAESNSWDTNTSSDIYWHSGEIELVDWHVSTAENVTEASNKLNAITGVVSAWGDYVLDEVAYSLAKVAYDAAELADNGLEAAMNTARSWYSIASSEYNQAVVYKNVQYAELMASATPVYGLFGEYWFTWYDPEEALEYAAAETYVNTVAWANLEAARASYNGASWTLQQNDRYVVKPLQDLMVQARAEMLSSEQRADNLEDAMHASGYYNDLSYDDDGLVALTGAMGIASAEYAAAQVVAVADFSADLEVSADVFARVGLKIDCVIDSGTVDAETNFALTSRTQYNQTSDMLSITPVMTNLTTGESIAFSTQSPNISFAASLLYDAGATLDMYADSSLVFAGETIYDTGDGFSYQTTVTLSDLASRVVEVDTDGDGMADTQITVDGIDVGELKLVEFNSETDLEPVTVPFIESLTSDIVTIDVAIPYVETEGVASNENPADFYDEGPLLEVDFSEISSTFFNMLNARVDFGEEFMERYGVASLTDSATLEAKFATIANGLMQLVFDQIDGQSDGVPIFVIDTGDETDSSLLQLNLAADPKAGANTGSLGFYTSYGESEPIVEVTLDIDQAVAVIANHIVLDVLTGGAYEGAEAVTNLPVINPLNIDVSLETILQMAYVDGATADAIKSFLDFGYTFEATDIDVNAAANVSQQFALSIDDISYVLELEDGTVYSFNASTTESVTIDQASSHDADGDGVIGYAFNIVPTAIFSNDTELGFSLGYVLDFLKGNLVANLKLPIADLGSFALPGIDIELGPLLEVTGEIDMLNVDVFETQFALDIGTEDFTGGVDINLIGVSSTLIPSETSGI